MAARIVVKFKSDVVGIPYQDGAHAVAANAFFTAAWATLAAAFPLAAINLNRLLRSQTGVELANLLTQASTRSGRAAPDLLRVMAIDLIDDTIAGLVANTVATWPFVEFAYVQAQQSLPVVNAADDPLNVVQGFLDAAPLGLDARHAWTVAGSDGTGVHFADVEWGWKLDHEDLAGAGVNPLNVGLPAFQAHSTACLGIVLAQDNTVGVVGLAPKVRGAIVSSRPTAGDLLAGLPDALVIAAVHFLSPGDILLLEVETADRKPVEIEPHIAYFLNLLNMLDIVVIEPAGNGNHDLDLLLRSDGTSLDRTMFNFYETHTIMVGARNSLSQTRISTLAWGSCFGTRVDCHAWGENIATTSGAATTAYHGVGGQPPFGGTSGASAIIAGAAAILQGIAKARGSLLTAARMRQLLSDPLLNTSATGRIGVMPDLKKIIPAI